MKIQVQNVTKQYWRPKRRTTSAVDAVDLTVNAGEMLAVVGPSGSGKTSLLRLIAGLEEPTQGQVLLDGTPVSTIQPDKRGMFMLFQDALLYPNLNVYDNLAMPLTLRQPLWKKLRMKRKRQRETIRAQVEAIARRFQISERLDALPAQLSRGERQRTALGRAMLSQPAVLLLDEPLSNLEPELRFHLRFEMASLREETGATVIHVTHDPFEAFTLGDRVAVLHRGRLQQIDLPERIYEEPANRFVAGFFGFPPMNFVEGWAKETEGEIQFLAPGKPEKSIQLKMPFNLAAAVGRPIMAGIRPEHVKVESLSSSSAQGSFEASTRRVEKFGAEVFRHLDVSGVSIVARDNSSRNLPKTGGVRVRLDESCILWFDSESSERIG